MHFSIPDTQELTDKTGSSFVAYNINVNGLHHCLLRYRQLSTFHDQFKKSLGSSVVPPFPPKKFLPLGQQQLEERRASLEKYIQIASQNSKISSCELFRKFFLSSQIETSRLRNVIGSNGCTRLALPVFLTKSDNFVVEVSNTDSTDAVMSAIAKQINLPTGMMPYFSLFIIQEDHQVNDQNRSDIDEGINSLSNCSWSQSASLRLIRKLQSFESPFLSMTTLNRTYPGKKHMITIRKSYFDNSFDEDIYRSDAGLLLLHSQAVCDVEQGWIALPREVNHQLTHFQKDGRRKQYLDLIRTIKYYSYTHFDNCLSDYPSGRSRCLISVGGREIVIRPGDISSANKDISFKVTRIRCWKLTTIPEIRGKNTCYNELSRLELSFEYLINRDQLRWITIESDQAVLISMSLQGMVEELLNKRKGQRTESTLSSSTSSHSSLSSSSPSSTCSSSSIYSKGSSSNNSNNNSPWLSSDASSHQLRKESRKSLDALSSCSSQESITSSSTMGANPNSSTSMTSTIKYDARLKRVTDNDAFEGIGDDDL